MRLRVQKVVKDVLIRVLERKRLPVNVSIINDLMRHDDR